MQPRWKTRALLPLVIFSVAVSAQPRNPVANETAAKQPRVVTLTTSSSEARSEFVHAREQVEDFRAPEALAGFQKALALDPNFAMAIAYLGFVYGGPEGLIRLKRAVDLAATLPSPERHYIDLLLAISEGELAKADRIVRGLMQEAPDDWRVFFEFGELAFKRHDWERAISAYRRSMVISDEPNRRCLAFNNLGYAEALVGRYDLAVAALQRCAELQPQQPNAFDSLGDVDLAANRLSEADANFHKSVSLAPDFWGAWHGIAVVSFAQGDWERGYVALAHARATTLPLVRLYVDSLHAWALFTEQKTAQALQMIDALEAAAKAAKDPGQYYFALAPLLRASMLNELGRFAEGLAAAKLCVERLRVSGLAGSISGSLRRRALRRQIWAEAKLGLPDMDQTLATIEEEAKAKPDDPELAGSAHLARGAVLLARHQPGQAAAELKRCHLDGLTEWSFELRLRPEGDEYCVWQLASVQDQLGDHVAATTTRGLLERRLSRDPMTLYIRSKLLNAPAHH